MKYPDLKTYIESLTITQGRHAGEAFTILPFQERFLRGLCRSDGDVALSVARGNGKSATYRSDRRRHKTLEIVAI